MRRRISLYIGGMPVDLDDQSFILFNYTQEDLSNPTIIKNSFSQQVTLKGTPANNRIFGGMWRSDRLTQAGGGNTGVDFNPARKTPFAIYDETREILESGYCRLDKVTRKRDNVEYTVSLFGQLGAFLYGLAYDDSGNRRSLADLKYTGQNAAETELDFAITRQAVQAAWNRLRGSGSDTRWDIINFAPAYNGIPSGLFDADKALVSTSRAGITIPQGYYSRGGDTVLATLTKEYTEWEAHDLRSYLQRPVVRMSAVINAICQPYNNGGYTVDLDPDFFAAGNPYWALTWLTLPLINSLDIQITEGGGSLVTAASRVTIPNGGNPSNNYRATIAIVPRLTAATYSTTGYVLHSYDTYSPEGNDNYVTGYYMTYLTYTIHAHDSNGNILQTRVVRVGTRETPENQIGIPAMDYVGTFDTSGVWSGEDIEVSFEGLGISYFSIWPNATAEGWGSLRHNLNPYIAWEDSEDIPPYEPNHVVNDYDFGYAQGLNVYTYTSSESARSGVTITKRMLLSSDKTPADYLLSFCKMFGLVIMCDKGERRVTISRRRSFFREDSLVDLTGRVSVADISVTPFAFDSKWYDFGLGYDKGEYALYYANIYGREYGLQRVNTGYEFNAEARDLLDGLAFKGACEVMENSKYFVDIINGTLLIPSVFQDGGTFSLISRAGESEDFQLPLPTGAVTWTWWNLTDKTYDFLSRPQFHDQDNSPFEERDTLLFLTGITDISQVTTRLGLSDDTALMMALNDNTPCWILDPAAQGGYDPVTWMPEFTRYYWQVDGGQRVAVKSLDFGTPAEVPIPDVILPYGNDIYTQYWRDYLTDRYDDDSRVMTCRVNLSGLKVDEDLLRDFYYYDGCVWSLNKIINHSLTTWDDTMCEFVKVQDKTNYR